MTTVTTDRNKMASVHGPILILIRGLPGSGKSHLAKVLRDTIGEDQVVLLDPDAIDITSDGYVDLSKSLTTEGVEGKFHPNRFLKARAHEAVSAHKVIIWNQPFSDPHGFERTVDNVRTYATEQQLKLPILLVEVEIDHDIAKKRIAQRREQGGHGPSKERFARFIDDYTSFADMGYPTVIVHGMDDVDVSTASVMQALREQVSQPLN